MVADVALHGGIATSNRAITRCLVNTVAPETPPRPVAGAALPPARQNGCSGCSGAASCAVVRSFIYKAPVNARCCSEGKQRIQRGQGAAVGGFEGFDGGDAGGEGLLGGGGELEFCPPFKVLQFTVFLTDSFCAALNLLFLTTRDSTQRVSKKQYLLVAATAKLTFMEMKSSFQTIAAFRQPTVFAWQNTNLPIGDPLFQLCMGKATGMMFENFKLELIYPDSSFYQIKGMPDPHRHGFRGNAPCQVSSISSQHWSNLLGKIVRVPKHIEKEGLGEAVEQGQGGARWVRRVSAWSRMAAMRRCSSSGARIAGSR